MRAQVVGPTISPMADWPDVSEGDAARTRAVVSEPDPGIVLARPHEVVAAGTVRGVPWLLQAFRTAPGPDGRWWEHGPVGPEMEFLLGRDGWFGGGGVNCLIPEGTHLTMTGHFFGRFPEIVSWVGVASAAVEYIEVRLDEGDVRRLDLHDAPEGFPRFFWFFPPRGAPGSVVAIGRDGAVVQSERLVDADVPADANSGITINGIGWPDGRPPPGWPPDPTAYAPGEGPRADEDFHLHVVGFPLHVVPPDRWGGYVVRSGWGGRGTGRPPEHVGFGYLDDLADPRRGFEVVNRSPESARERDRFERRPRAEDVGIWMADINLDAEVVNFAGRFLGSEGRARSLRPFRLEPRRYVGAAEATVAGRGVVVERWEYMRFRELRRIVCDLPEVRIVLHGWAIVEDDLVAFATQLERLELGTPLFEALGRAQARSDARLRELHP